jgi:hypothetical protein
MAWKPSTLAVLFHGLTREARHKYGPLETVSEMDEIGKAIDARLQQTHLGLRFFQKDEANL